MHLDDVVDIAVSYSDDGTRRCMQRAGWTPVFDNGELWPLPVFGIATL
jgi:hypothetical protein